MKRSFLVVLFLTISLTLFSQTKMIINKNNGTSDSLNLSDIKNITFKISVLPIPTQGLIAYYPFNGNANDESGNGHNGTVYGASLTADRFGNTNGAYSFNGTSDYIILKSADIASNLRNHTVELWFNWTGVTNTIDFTTYGQMIYGENTGDGAMYRLKIYPDTSLGFLIDTARSPEIPLFYSRKIIANRWYQISAVLDSTIGQKLYVNGELIATNSSTHTQSSLSGPIVNTALSYDKWNGGTHSRFYGLIDDIRIYSRALSYSEIQALYHERGW